MVFPLFTSVLLTASTLSIEELEAGILDTTENAFRIPAEQLNIVTEQGDTVSFSNTEEPEEIQNGAMYYLIDHLPAVNFWTVEMHGYEWMEWYAVSGSTGQVTTTIGPCIPDPSGARILCVMEDIMAEYIYNGVQIWLINSDGSLSLEFEDLDVPWGPVKPVWTDENTVEFSKLSCNHLTYSYSTAPGKLRLNSVGEWEPACPEDWQ